MCTCSNLLILFFQAVLSVRTAVYHGRLFSTSYTASQKVKFLTVCDKRLLPTCTCRSSKCKQLHSFWWYCMKTKNRKKTCRWETFSNFFNFVGCLPCGNLNELSVFTVKSHANQTLFYHLVLMLFFSIKGAFE